MGLLNRCFWVLEPTAEMPQVVWEALSRPYCVKLNCYRRPPYCFIIAVTELACAQTAATAAPELSLSVSKAVRGSIRDKWLPVQPD